MPGLTSDVQIIAYSEGCPRQIVAYSGLVLGFQCHMELTKEAVTLLIENDDLSDAGKSRFVEHPDRLLSHNYDDMNQKLHTFLDKLESYYKSKH